MNKDTLRDSIIHGLRMAGWSRIEAEQEADNRILRQHKKVDKTP